jgi:lactaldehyde reductase
MICFVSFYLHNSDEIPTFALRKDNRLLINKLKQMVNRFILNEVSYFGPGARKELPGVVKRLGFKKALVVTDKGLMQFGVAKMVLDVMDEAGIAYEIFDDVKPNPTVTNVKNGIEACKQAKADFIVAIGGGSSMDTAKGIGIVVNNPEFSDIISLEGVADTKKKSLPIIALPTTAGTAAETTINYVIIDESRQAKMVCVDPNDIPCVAIIDAELMYSLPKSLTAATGMDAMTHAIEGLITKAAWELSDMFEVKAIEMIYKYLPLAVDEPKNPKGRDGMAVAQYVAGMAFSNVGLGVDHGMAHPLSALFDVPHGVACAMLLPTVMRFNMPAALEKYTEIAKACGVWKDGMSKEEAAEAACKAIEDLSARVGTNKRLTDLGITEKDIDALADQAINDVCTPGNPRTVTRDDIVSLYKQIL